MRHSTTQQVIAIIVYSHQNLLLTPSGGKKELKLSFGSKPTAMRTKLPTLKKAKWKKTTGKVCLPKLLNKEPSNGTNLDISSAMPIYNNVSQMEIITPIVETLNSSVVQSTV